jgi:hypothetical protein
MADLDTCRMPRDTLLGLIHSSTNHDRITAPIPIPTLTELLGDEVPRGSEPAAQVPEPAVVVRFTPSQPIHVVARSHWIIAISAAVTVLVGAAVIFLA